MPDIVVDIGNTRVKWGRCSATGISAVVGLAPHDFAAWEQQLTVWNLRGPLNWATASVHPERRDLFQRWAEQRGDTVTIVRYTSEFPLAMKIPHPELVGIDRLLDVLAAKQRLHGTGPAIVVDAGTAVTVNWLDADGAFAGGVIFPGLQLMARSLHEHTAQLPEVTFPEPPTSGPGLETMSAIQTGIYWTIIGGIEMHIRTFGSQRPPIFLTGGAGPLLAPHLPEALHCPELTLEGVRWAVS